MTPAEFLGMARQFIEVFNRHDLEALDRFYAEGAVRESLAVGRAEGKEAIRRSREELFRAFPDLTLDYRHQFFVGTHGVIEWVMRGTHTGVLEIAAGRIPPTGKRIEVSGVTVFEIYEPGLIVRERAYPDLLGMLNQLGAIKMAAPV